MRSVFSGLLLLCLLAPAYAAQSSNDRGDDHDLDKMSDAQRNTTLSQGYAQLYEAVSALRWMDEALLLKFESKPTELFIKDLAGYSSEVREQLERLEKDYPSLSLKDDGLPLLTRSMRKAAAKDRLKNLAPITGAKGAEFERTLLLTQSGTLNQLRFLAREIALAESNADRRKFASGVAQRFERLYGDVLKLLNQHYFCARDAKKSKRKKK